MTTAQNPTKAIRDLKVGQDRVIVSDRLATFISRPLLQGQAQRVAEITDHQDGTWSMRLDGMEKAIGCKPEQEVSVLVTVESPGVFSERARVVTSVPKTANFEFAYDGHSFFTLRGELLAVAR